MVQPTNPMDFVQCLQSYCAREWTQLLHRGENIVLKSDSPRASTSTVSRSVPLTWSMTRHDYYAADLHSYLITPWSFLRSLGYNSFSSGTDGDGSRECIATEAIPCFLVYIRIQTRSEFVSIFALDRSHTNIDINESQYSEFLYRLPIRLLIAIAVRLIYHDDHEQIGMSHCRCMSHLCCFIRPGCEHNHVPVPISTICTGESSVY